MPSPSTALAEPPRERLLDEAALSDPEGFAHSWHILMKGSIIAAAEGDPHAANRARQMAHGLIDAHAGGGQ